MSGALSTFLMQLLRGLQGSKEDRGGSYGGIITRERKSMSGFGGVAEVRVYPAAASSFGMFSVSSFFCGQHAIRSWSRPA